MNKLENKVEIIIARNKKVELDKKWETSWTRRLFLAILTFIAAYIFLQIIKVENAIYGAMVPTGAFLLQQMTISPLKKIWGKLTK